MAPFCASPFWSNNVTWYTDDPDFTDCFQKTVLIWIPFVYLWVTLPFQVYFYASRETLQTLKNRWLYGVKMTLSILLALLTLAEVAIAAKNLSVPDDSSPFIGVVQFADLAAPLIQFLSFMLAMFYQTMDYKQHRRSSGLLMLFWLLILVPDAVRLRTIIKLSLQDSPHWEEQILVAFQAIGILLIVGEIICASIPAEALDIDNDFKNTTSPEKSSTFLSQLLFCWFSRLIYRGWRRTLTDSDLWDLNAADKARVTSEKFENYVLCFIRRGKRTGIWIILAILLSFWTQLLFTILLKLIYNASLFVVPEILRLLIGFVKDERVETWKGYLFAALLLATTALQTLAIGHFFHHSNKLGLRIRTAIMGVIYRKISRTAQFRSEDDMISHPTNLISIDAQRVMDICSYVNQIWEIPLQISISIWMLWRVLGVAAFAGLGVIVISVPLGIGTAAWSKRLQLRQMQAKDDRIRLTGEVFRSIKILKLNAWEEAFQKKISRFRHEELRHLRTIQFLQAFSTFFSSISPLLVAIVTFTVYVLMDERNVLDTSKAFVALSIFNILKGPMNMLPPTIGNFVQAWVSVHRIAHAITSEEPEHYGTHVPKDAHFNSGVLLQIKHGEFAWSVEGPECLRDINLDVGAGKLIGIVGQSGSGKTALCRAMLGLMDRRAGIVSLKGRVSYMPQQNWLQSKTVRENITFGRPYISENYETILDKCCLTDDLASLADGDDTELSDQGSNLSGGQKQRISIARTIYSYSDIFILDDPLSALDAKVSKELFDNVFGSEGLLKDKTRIIVMNNYRFLPKCDLLVVMDNGTISEMGSFDELSSRPGPFADFLRYHLRQEIEDLHQKELEASEATHRHEALEEICRQLPKDMRRSLKLHRKSVVSMGKPRKGSVTSRLGTLDEIHYYLKKANSSQPTEPIKAKPRHLTHEPEATVSSQSRLQVLVSFIHNISLGVFCSIILTNAISTGFSVGSGIWLSEWSEENMTTYGGAVDTTQRDFRLGVYAALGGLQAAFFYLSMMLLAYGLIRASTVLHHRLLHHLLRASMFFFDTTPIGRITNRFSKDIDAIDMNVPQSLRQCLNSAFNILATISILIYSYPIFAAFLVPIVAVYAFIQVLYIRASRQLKQLESTTRSPIFSHFDETLSGAEVINNFGQRGRFIREFEGHLDNNDRLSYLSLVSQRWLSVRLELVGNIMVFITAVLAVYGRGHWDIHSGHVGLSITYAVQVTQVLSWFVQKMSDLEMSFISVERVKDYTRCPQEAPWTIEKTKPQANWPSSGLIELRNYKTRYRPDLELALKGLTCRIHPNEKVGIVGRTGAGKSSLSLGIFRIIEPAEGAILIDGIDISKIGLHDLRSRITIIPQDPILLSGTLRDNLDPSNAFSDSQIWHSLDSTHLKHYVNSLPGVLNHAITESGGNLSTGQRQLICLARAILRKSKILLLDEATASLDAETDEIVQKTIQEEFADCTVLIIAHRIQSVIDCDRVMVLDHGQILEFDSPTNLLDDEASAFRGLVKDSNLLGDVGIGRHRAFSGSSAPESMSSSLSSSPEESTSSVSDS